MATVKKTRLTTLGMIVMIIIIIVSIYQLFPQGATYSAWIKKLWVSFGGFVLTGLIVLLWHYFSKPFKP